MLDYIQLDNTSPILNQLPYLFRSAVILLHPFVQMPLGWGKQKRQNPFEHIYPDNLEILKFGNPVSWRNIMYDSGLQTEKELALGLKTSIGALREEFTRIDLSDKLNLNFRPDLYYPTEDSTSVFLIEGLLRVLGSKGANKIYFSEPIFGNSGFLNINDTSPLEISELTDTEIILTDENMDFAFMSVYDSFVTLLMAKDENIDNIVQSMNWEVIKCDDETYISWYL